MTNTGYKTRTAFSLRVILARSWLSASFEYTPRSPHRRQLMTPESAMVPQELGPFSYRPASLFCCPQRVWSAQEHALAGQCYS
jgi:hypothetical protein